jgi:N-acetylneuraminate synthase
VKPIRPYIIAEISANHSKNLSRIFKIIDGVAESGATAVKLQTFTADQMTVRSRTARNLIPKDSGLWAGRDLWSLMKEAELPFEWHKEIFEYVRSLGMDVFSTAYHPDALQFLLELGVDAIKVSSFDVVNHPLLVKVAAAKLPVILSTGMATEREIDEAVEIISGNVPELILLKCTSAYPCRPEDCNLLGITSLRQRYNLQVGYSDHSLDSQAASIALSLGATVFERHVKLDSEVETLDSIFSSTPKELAEYIASLEKASKILGSSKLEPTSAENSSLWERPSVVALCEIGLDEIFTEKNIGIRRPNIGAHPKHLPQLIGTKSTRQYQPGDGIN